MIVATQKEAAKACEVTPRQFRNWLGESWFPPDARGEGGYDIEKIKAARDAEGRKGSEQSEKRHRVRDAFAEERLKRERIKTRREELGIQQEEGQLIPRQAVEVFASALLTEFGDWCDTLPGFVGRLVPASAKKRVKEALITELNQRRELLAQTLHAKAQEFDHLQTIGGDQSA